MKGCGLGDKFCSSRYIVGVDQTIENGFFWSVRSNGTSPIVEHKTFYYNPSILLKFDSCTSSKGIEARLG